MPRIPPAPTTPPAATSQPFVYVNDPLLAFHSVYPVDILSMLADYDQTNH